MIQVEQLVKRFGPKVAVNRISFQVERGEVLGFLGPNGAGKSTTMRMITGFIPPSEGSVTVGDHPILEQPIQAKRLMGYLPESAPCYPDMNVYGFLDLRPKSGASAAAIGKRQPPRGRSVLPGVGAAPECGHPLQRLPHRTCFAQSIIHDPDVLIMDEPTDGLDPNQKHEVRASLSGWEKKAIIFSTHILRKWKLSAPELLSSIAVKLWLTEPPKLRSFASCRRRSITFGSFRSTRTSWDSSAELIK